MYVYIHVVCTFSKNLRNMPALYSDILLCIFQLLPLSALFNIVQVSKHWNSIAIAILWSRPLFKKSELSIYAPLFEFYGQFIRKIEFNHSVEDDVRLVVVNSCCNLTSVEFRHAEITIQEITMLCTHLSEQLEVLIVVKEGNGNVHGVSTLAQFIATLRKLKTLRLGNMIDFEDVACNTVIVGCPLLEDLDLERSSVTDAGVDDIAQHLPHLFSISLPRCDRITDNSLITIAQSCSTLVYLNVSFTKITDATLLALSSACCRETIVYFNLSFCQSITDTGVRLIITHFPRLRYFFIVACFSLTKRLFEETLWNCTQLVELGISSLDVGSSERVSKHALLSLAKLPNLQSLDLSCNNFVDNDLAKKIAGTFSLTYLTLEGTSVSGSCLDELKNRHPNVNYKTSLSRQFSRLPKSVYPNVHLG
jgi:F-box-like/Leucine Rich repeat